MSLLGTSGISDSTQGHCHRLESIVASRCCPVTAEASFRPTFYLSCNPEYFLKRLASAVQLRPWPPHFKELSGNVSCLPSPLSVRYFSTRSRSVPGYDDGEGLKRELPLAQSAFSPLLSAAWLKIAVSIAPTAAMRSSLTRRDMEAPFRTGCVHFRASRH